jgi:hypothetical protein
MRSEGLFSPFGAQYFFVNFPCIRFELAPVAMLQQHVHRVVINTTAQLSYKRMHIYVWHMQYALSMCRQVPHATSYYAIAKVQEYETISFPLSYREINEVMLW